MTFCYYLIMCIKQVSGSLLESKNGIESIGIGTILGWGMAAIYMGGRLPQIFLNVRIPLS